MKTPVRALLFDLGGTLMYSKQPWEPILQRGYQAMADVLCAHGFRLDCSQLPRTIRYHLDRYFARRDEDLVETTYMTVLRELLAEQGVTEADPAVLRRALDAFYAHTQPNWTLEDDALFVLRTLEAGGYHMGLISNAGDNQDVLELVQRFRIKPFFDFILTSAACSYRKPHPRIFELALAHWNFSPQEAAMIGDSLEADILGAHRLGLRTVWVTRRVSSTATRLEVQPDAKIESLRELPSLLSHLEA